MEGTLTATVEVAGPFKVEAKPLSIDVEPTAYAIKYARIWMPVLGIVFVLVIVVVVVVVLVAQRKKQ